MSNSKKWLVVLLSVLVTVLCGAALAACDSNSNWREAKNGVPAGVYDPNNPDGSSPFYFADGVNPDQFKDDANAYTLTVTSKGGMPLSNVKVTVRKNGAEITSARSGEDGTIKLNISPDNYEIVYDEMPAGYFTDGDTLTRLNAKDKNVTAKLNSAVIDETVPANHVYQAGEVMYNFKYTDSEGTTIELKELLEDYDFVLLNFFFTTCGPCIGEFPAIQRTYEAYQDIAYIVSVDPRDSASEVAAFKQAGYSETVTGIVHPYTFFMARDNQSLFYKFSTNAFPTNVFIDRYGVIAYIDAGGRPQDVFWTDLFARFTAEDYEQNSDLMDNSAGSEEAGPRVKPPEEMTLPGDEEMTKAVLDKSNQENGSNVYDPLPLHFYGPSADNPDEENDAIYSWPFQIGETDEDGSYIYPGNVGTDWTYSIMHTDLTLETDQILSLELRLETEESGDPLYFIINNTIDYDLTFNGSTDNKWINVELYTATRPTNIHLTIMYMKDLLGTPNDEFVGIRNLKISNIEVDPNKPLDVRTEMATPEGDGMKYQKYYLSDADGYYHVETGSVHSAKDPIVYCDVLNESTWSLRHISRYQLKYEDSLFIKSIYNLSYYLFNPALESEDGHTVFMPYDPKETIIDAFYIQRYSTAGYLVPVTKDLGDALKGFTKSVSEDLSEFYDGGFDADNTWLELCVYYRTLGEGHDDAGHVCLSTSTPVLGLTTSFAIPVKCESGETKVTFTTKVGEETQRNHLGGLFYTFTAPANGVYRFSSSNVRPAATQTPVVMFVWGSANDPYTGASHPLLQFEDLVTSRTDFSSLAAYLQEGQTIYLQLSQMSYSENDTERIFYDVTIEKYAEEDWILTSANDENYWTYDMDTGEMYYPSVEIREFNENDGYYYYYSVDGEQCSPIYIDFVHRNNYDANGHSLFQMIQNGNFNLSQSGGRDLTTLMMALYNKSIEGKDTGDADYGLLHADRTLVSYLAEFTEANDPTATFDSGAWKAFAFYYRYCGGNGIWSEPNF